MPLIQEAQEPSIRLLNQVSRRTTPASVHHTWLDYLYWDSELQL
jgi:hypothetical protein